MRKKKTKETKRKCLPFFSFMRIKLLNEFGNFFSNLRSKFKFNYTFTGGGVRGGLQSQNVVA